MKKIMKPIALLMAVLLLVQPIMGHTAMGPYLAVEEEENFKPTGGIKKVNPIGVRTLNTMNNTVLLEQSYTEKELYLYLEEQIKAAMLAGESSIDLTDLNISYNEYNLAYIQYYSPYFSIDVDLSPYYSVGDGIYGTLKINNAMSVAETKKYFDDVDEEMENIYGLISDEMTDEEKALVVHDYLVYEAEYDTSFCDAAYLSSGVIMRKAGVCMSYAFAFKYIMDHLGIECYYVVSDELNHAWNIVKIDEEYYQLDCTWDDPLADQLGRVKHHYFLLTDDVMGTDHPLADLYNPIMNDVDISEEIPCDSTIYEDYYWTNILSSIIFYESDQYYIFENSIVKRDDSGNESILATPSWGSNGYYQGTFSGLFLYEDELYYNTSDELRKITLDGKTDTLVLTIDIPSGYYLNGSKKVSGGILYEIAISDIVDKNAPAYYRYTYKTEWADADDSGNEEDEEIGEYSNVTVDNVMFKIMSDGTAKLIDGSSASGEYTIPSQVSYNGKNYTVTTIRAGAFFDNTNLSRLIMPDTIITIESGNQGAFCHCTSLEEVVFSDNLEYIGDSAFFRCLSLTNVVLPDSLVTIENDAFRFCSGIRSLALPNSVVTVGQYAFSGTSLVNFRIPATATSFSKWALRDIETLESVTVDEEHPCFSSLDGVLYSKGYHRIELYPCQKKDEIYEVHSNATKISGGTFNGNEYLKKLILNEKMDIESFSTAMLQQSVIEEIEVPVTNPNLMSMDGVLYTKDGKHLLFYPLAKQDKVFFVPTGVEEIGYSGYYYSFEECMYLEEVYIPASVKTISGTFWMSSALKKVVFASDSKLTNLDGSIFQDCISLESICLPKSIVLFEPGNGYGSQFLNCENLQTLYIAQGAPFYEQGNWAIQSLSGCAQLTVYGYGEDNKLSEMAEEFYCDYVNVADGFDKVLGITFADTDLTLRVGMNANLNTVVYPEVTTAKTLTYVSSNTDIVTVDANGNITAISEGTCYITATATDGSGEYARCRVTILKKWTEIVEDIIEEIENAEEGSTVVVDMETNGETVTEALVEILEAVSGKDVDVLLEYNDYSWTINGQDITAENLEAISLEVVVDANVIENELVEEIADGDESIQISLTHDGEFGFSAELTINVNSANAGQYGTLYYYNEAGELEYVSSALIDETGNVVFTFTHASDYVIVIGEERKVEEEIINPFTDIEEGQYYYMPVLWAVENNITAGLSATKFGPNETCTRAQIVTFLWRNAGCPAPTLTTNPFKDVPNDAYYAKAVLWAVENEITAGVSATKFGPDATCTRAQIVTFLWRAFGEQEPTTITNPFKDVPADAYYAKAVLWAVENNITAGVSSTKFGPEAACTRGQVVSFLYRAYAE